MNSLLKKFQDVVEMGHEQETSDRIFSQEPQGSVTSSSDPTELRRHIATLTQKLARQAEAYEELQEESAGIEKELTRLRLRFAASRELWGTANEQLEVVIQNLLEHQLFGNIGTPTARGKSDVSSRSLDATYISSLQEQIQRLKEMVQRSGEERTQLRSEKQYEQSRILMHSSGLAGAVLDAEVRQALKKMMLHWQEERSQLEAVIENLEHQVSRHAEREALLSDQIKQEKELHQRAAAITAQSCAEIQALRAAKAELEEWRSGARALDSQHCHSSNNNAAAPLTVVADSATVSERIPKVENSMQASAEDEQSTTQAGSAIAHLSTTASTAACLHAAAPTPLRLKALFADEAATAATEHTDTNSVDARVLHAQQQTELETLRQDYAVREEALDSLYADNKNLQEALQRSEALACQYAAELQDCRRRLEEVQKELTRKEQRTKRIEEEYQKAAQAESKLRDRVIELRQALSAAAAASASTDHDVVVPPSSDSSRGGMAIPQWRGVRVSRPPRYEVAEQAITYGNAGTWREWAVEAWSWWKELKGGAVLRAPLTTSSSFGSRSVGRAGRITLAPRRGLRVLLFFAGMVSCVMLLYLLLAIIESMYAAFESPKRRS